MGENQMKRQLADAASDRHASHAQPTVPGSLFLAFSLPFFLPRLPSYLTVIRVINCSIKASLRIQNTLDAQPPGKRVVQLW